MLAHGRGRVGSGGLAPTRGVGLGVAKGGRAGQRGRGPAYAGTWHCVLRLLPSSGATAAPLAI